MRSDLRRGRSPDRGSCHPCLNGGRGTVAAEKLVTGLALSPPGAGQAEADDSTDVEAGPFDGPEETVEAFDFEGVVAFELLQGDLVGVGDAAWIGHELGVGVVGARHGSQIIIQNLLKLPLTTPQHLTAITFYTPHYALHAPCQPQLFLSGIMSDEGKASQYDELKDVRQKTLVKEYEQFLLGLKMQMSKRDAQECERQATRWGVVDEIDEKVCLKRRVKSANHLLLGVLPEITQHANNYEQCLQECAKNHISYLVANHSCRAAYERNFKNSTQSIMERLLRGQFPQ